MSTIESVILGFVQGLTEFLPISSTGHLILARTIFSVENINALAFDAMLHLATAAAVIIYFRTDIWLLLQTVFRKLGRLPVNERDETLIYALLAGTVPAIILGLSFESLMETIFRSPILVAVILIVGSVLFMFAEWRYIHQPRRAEISIKKGLKVGLFQSLALIPGMSRSGASIAGGMILGLTRYESARFSFLLAVPLILGAGAKKFLELISSDSSVDWILVGTGSLAAFVVGLFAIHFMLSFVRRHTLWTFIWYRIILACFVIFIFVFG